MTMNSVNRIKKAHLISLGCARNRVDSEVMLGKLLGQGWQHTDSLLESDVAIINTCGFIEAAKEESINTILECSEYKARNKNLKIVVAGCLTQRYKTQLAKGLPEVDLFIGTDEFVRLPELLADTDKKNHSKVHAKRTHYIYDEHHPRVNTLSTHSAYIKVAEGCQHNCSFCIIPAIRGKLRSRPASSIIAEAKNLSESGVKEINLIAQDLAAYGRDRTDGADLLSLLKELVKIEKLHWIRLLYMYPENITQEFLQFFAEEKKLVKYLDIPIQHGSNKILKDMKRDVTIEEIEETISQLRAKVPTVAIRTSVMVGFPGETEKDFEDLASFVKRARIEHLGCFSYSKEDGTVAARMSDQVEEHVKKERQEKIMALQKEISRAGLEKHLGKTYEALIEKQDKKDKDLWLARLSTQAPEVDGILYVINTKETELNQGDMILVRIIETKEYDLIGETI
jgi:ribosomal protein S12 methylthiotransferase